MKQKFYLLNGVNVNGNTRLGNASGDTVGFYTTTGSSQQNTGVASATVVNGTTGDAIHIRRIYGCPSRSSCRKCRITCLKKKEKCLQTFKFILFCKFLKFYKIN